MFEDAAQRLARDQQKIRGRKPVVVSEQAKRQADLQRKQRAQMQAARERKRRLQDYQNQYLKTCEQALRVTSLGGTSGDQQQHLLLQPTSIYGTGDKVSLPPSVLETLTAEMGDSSSLGGNPWTFRIGILNEDYQFPASALMQTLKPPADFTDDHPMMDDSDNDNEGDESRRPYLDEMRHKYVAYTHCTVVEFTQDEGYVGIPQHIASALLDPTNRRPQLRDTKSIPVTRTVDPASKTASKDESVASPSSFSATEQTTMTAAAVDDSGGLMDADPSTVTPGHVAYGAFDIPDVPLEISLVKLPKGTGCTLVPTKEAVQRGFYGLKDVKLVLEQSLIRTRATLSQGDVVSTWHRGVQYDLFVTKVIPSAFGAVTCINTDIEVDIGEVQAEESDEEQSNNSQPLTGHKRGTGQTLGSVPSRAPATSILSASPPVSSSSTPVVLLPEPPSGQTENIVNVQIRYDGGNAKRRFDVTKATVRDLLDFASSLLSSSSKLQDVSTFRLVTRFPRRVFAVDSGATQTLGEAGIPAGQELFLVEMV